MAFQTAGEAKKSGWFSRRHQSSVEHVARQAEFIAYRSLGARRLRAFERQQACDKLTPEQRLAELDRAHLTAKRERSKLAARIGGK